MRQISVGQIGQQGYSTSVGVLQYLLVVLLFWVSTEAVHLLYSLGTTGYNKGIGITPDSNQILKF